MIRVLIVDDHALVSEGLHAMLSMVDALELVGVATSGEEALDLATEQHADVVLMDVNLGKSLNGIETTRLIKQVDPSVKVLMLSMFTDPATVTEAVKAGADGYLSKSASRDAMVHAIREVMEGHSVLDPHVTEGVFGRLGAGGATGLTDRELTVLQELTHGNSTRDIAGRIHVSEETVKTYLKQIYKKLDVRDRAEAVAEAFRRGLVH